MNKIKLFSQILLWEFGQNIPLVAGFVFALRAWQRGAWEVAIALIITSSIIGAIVIRETEPKILTHFKEVWLVTFSNIVLMSFFMVLLVQYFSVAWPQWYTDIMGGVMIALILGSMQSLVAGEAVMRRHVVAFLGAFPLTLVALRYLLQLSSELVIIGVVTTVLTIVISVLDYRHLLAKVS